MDNLSELESQVLFLRQKQGYTINETIKELNITANILKKVTEKLQNLGLYSEEERLSQKLISLKAQANTESNELANEIKADIDNSSFELQQYDDILVRKVVECVKILNKEEISVTFKGGYEIKSELLT